MKKMTLPVKLLSSILFLGGISGIFSVSAQDQNDSVSANSLSTGIEIAQASTGGDQFGGDPFGGDPFGGMIDSNSQIPPIQQGTQSTTTKTSVQNPTGSTSIYDNVPPSGTESSTSTESSGSTKKAELPFSSAASRAAEPVPSEPSSFQNAIIEGIQLTSEKSETTDERIISCYFIFRDKPTSYFYEVKVREKKLIFEFNDTKTGSSPVPAVSELPIKGFTIESGKLDANKDVKGLLPEWHDMIRVIFDLEAVPKIHVSDEYSIISFSFKWTSDPSKLKQYVVKDNSRKVIILSTAGVGGAALGTALYFFLKPKEQPVVDGPLPIDDLPQRPLGSGK